MKQNVRIIIATEIDNKASNEFITDLAASGVQV